MEKVKIKKNGSRRWSEDEIRLLKRLYPNENTQCVADKLGRSMYAVSMKAHQIGIAKKTSPWTKQEELLLKKLFPLGKAEEIAEHTGRSLAAVKRKASILGIKTNKYWSPDEIRLLMRLYPDESVRSIAQKIGRPETAVMSKAYEIGLMNKTSGVWSSQEIVLLKTLYPNNTIRDIANELGRTDWAVRAKAHRLGLTETRPREWSERELNLLKELYPSKTAQEIAEQIGRPLPATQMRIHLLGLEKQKRVTKKYHSYDETHRTVQGVKQKLCTQCKEWKGYSEFRKKSISKDGLKIHCKKCDRAYEAALHRKHRMKNKGRVRLSFEERHRVVRGVKEKLCCHCESWKDESQFHRARRSKDGLHFECKECVGKRTRRYYERIREAGRRNLRSEDRHRVVDGIKQKFCRKCNQWKGESEFYKNQSTRDGLEYWCKECFNECRRRRRVRNRKTGRRNLRSEDRHRVVDGIKQKFCRKCKRWKNESEFYRIRSTRDGLHNWCKKCLSKAAKKRHKAAIGRKDLKKANNY